MSTCSACGAQLDPNGTSCAACGVEAEDSKAGSTLGFVCQSCEHYNDAGALDCSSCGAALAPSGFTGLLKVASIERHAAPQSRQPESTQPESTQSESTQPESTQPESTQPESTQPESTQPESTQPEEHECPAPGPGTKVFGALPSGRAKLTLVRGTGFSGAEFRLNAPEVGAGRSRGLVLFPDDIHLSELHATFLYRAGKLFLRDEGSASGSWYSLREPLTLGSDMELAIGESRLSISEVSAGSSRELGASVPPDALRVEERLVGDRPGRAWVCAGQSITMGRAGCDVAIDDDDLIDRSHVRVRSEGGGRIVEDADSEDGTFVRAGKGELIELRHRDRVRIGGQVLEVSVA